jgi:PST family polysaccharide transporter
MGVAKTDAVDDVRSASPSVAAVTLAGAVAWTASVKWGSQVLTWAATLAVARLLTPHDYGIVAMAGVYLGLIAILNEFGIGLAVVAHRQLGEAQIAQLNGLAITIGVAAVGVSAAAALPLGRLLGQPELPPVVVVMGAVFFVTSLRTVAIGRLQQALAFGRLASAEGVQAITTALSTVILALLGLQYWALVLGQVIGQTIFTIVVLTWVPPAFARPRMDALGEVLTFTRRVIIGRVSWFIQTGADFAIVGSLLGNSALGLYAMAQSLGKLPVEKVGGLLSQVTPAFLAASQDDRAGLRRLILTLTEALALSVFPLAVGMLVVAPEAVALALGNQWADIIPPLQIFAPLAAVDAICAIFFPVLLVTGGSRLTMSIALVSCAIFPLAFYIGSHWGLIGVAAAYAIVAPVMRVPAYVGVARRTGLAFTAYLKALWPALSATAMMAIVVLGVRFVVPAGWPLMLRGSGEVLAGGATYAIILATIHRSRVVQFYRVFRELRGGATRAAAGSTPGAPLTVDVDVRNAA